MISKHDSSSDKNNKKLKKEIPDEWDQNITKLKTRKHNDVDFFNTRIITTKKPERIIKETVNLQLTINDRIA
jgi:hypothetical protein